MNIRSAVSSTMITLLLLVSSGCAEQPRPPPSGERHPAYLHALTDLREARWLIQHRNGEGVANADEQVAIGEINGAIGAIRQAAFDDGKDANYQAPPDVPANGPGRLHKAMNLLGKVHSDLAREEDNGFAQGLKERAIQRVDAAAQATDRAIHDLQGGR